MPISQRLLPVPVVEEKWLSAGQPRTHPTARELRKMQPAFRDTQSDAVYYVPTPAYQVYLCVCVRLSYGCA